MPELSPPVTDTYFPIPAMLYGKLGEAGRGWRSVAKRAWNLGWAEALDGMEWLNLYQTHGPIVLGERPSPSVTPQYKTHPYIAAYIVHDTLTDILAETAEANQKMPEDVMAAYRRMRNLLVEALDWPWYVISTFWPETAFMPDRALSGYLKNYAELHAELHADLRRLSAIALQKIAGHFQCLVKIESRFSRDGWTPPLPFMAGKMRWGAAMKHAIKLGLDKSDFQKWLVVPHYEAEKGLLDWINAHSAEWKEAQWGRS